MEFLSCGVGMQSSALAFMSCENKRAGRMIHPGVPIYDGILFCDLGHEPPWVYEQAKLIEKACSEVGIPFVILNTDLYGDWMRDFGYKRTTTIPFWTINQDGGKGRLPRFCTIDYKITVISNYIKWNFLGYKPHTKTRKEDLSAHGMHIGFSNEESRRCAVSKHPCFKNKFPLVDMGWVRRDSYKYIRDVWGYEFLGSACNICPYHTNHFFKHLKENHPESFEAAAVFDRMLEERQGDSKFESQLFISRSRKRVYDLNDKECMDGEFFECDGEMVWNGF